MRRSAVAGMLLAASLLVAMRVAAAASVGVTWLAGVNASTTYPLVPVHLRVSAYSVAGPSLLYTRCNIVVHNSTSVVDLATVAGSTADYYFVPRTAGRYVMDVYCVAVGGNETSRYRASYAVTVNRPPVTLKPTRARFGRETVFTVESLPVYNTVVRVEVGNETLILPMRRGVAVFNYTLYRNTTVRVRLLGAEYSFNVSVGAVRLVVDAPSRVQAGEDFKACIRFKPGLRGVPATVVFAGARVEASTGGCVRLHAPRRPGNYTIRAESLGYTAAAEVTVTPRRPSLPPSRARVYAGAGLNASMPYYVAGGVAVEHYPGTVGTLPGDTYVLVEEVYPRILLREDWVRVEDAAPGANLTVICYRWNATAGGPVPVTLLEAHLRGGVYTARWNDTCLYVEAVYRYGAYVERVLSNSPEPVRYVTECSGPCVVVYPSPAVSAVLVDGEPYRPGAAAELRPGAHLVVVQLRDGYTVEYTLHVRAEEYAVVYIAGDRVRVEGCPVEIVTSQGLVLRLGPGESAALPSPVVYVDSVCPVRVIHLR